jgi:hypothetical protein
MDFIGIDKHGVPNAEVVPLLPEQNSASAVSDDHSVLVSMLVECGISARWNRKVPDDKVHSSFGNPQQNLLGNACRCVGAIMAQRNGWI